MNNPEESALTDLSKLAQNVLNGMLDMQNSAVDFIRYQFHVRSVKDVIRRATEDETLINQISDQIHHMIIYLNEEIVDLAIKATPSGFNDHHFEQLEKRIHLLYELWKGMQVNDAYKVPALMRHVDACQEAVKHAYDVCRGYHRWIELSDELQEFFLGVKKEEKPVIEDAEPTLFAREDGVVSSLAHEKAQSDEEGKKKQFVAKTEKVLNNYRAKNPDYKTMRELITAKTKFRLEGIYCDNLINEFIYVWDMAIDYEADKPEQKNSFTTLLKKVFSMMVDQRRNDLATKLFDKYKDAGDVLPCLENFVENFQGGLTEAINQLPLDSNVLSNSLELFEKSKEPIMWYLLVSPAYTVQQLLTICIDNKGYIPIIGRIFRCMPTLFERFVQITPLPYEQATKNKLLITILHRIFKMGRTTWKSASQWDNAGMMTMSFAKERKRKEGQPEKIEDRALIDPFSLLNFALSELLKDNRKPTKSVEIFVKMLQRLLANNNNARMYTNYSYGTSFNTESDNTLKTPIIINLMFDLLMEFDGQSIEVCDGAREVLRAIGGRMESDGTVFDADTCAYFTEGQFNAAPWWIKYSIYTWFSTALNKPKRQVPSGVYKTIPERFLDDFEQIKAEEVSTVSDCYMRSLFELGLYNVDLALDLLSYGYDIKFEESVLEKMTLALVDSYGKKLSRRNGGLEIGKLITAMIKKFDPIRELAPLSSYTESYIDSLKKTEHILILFKATRMAKEKQLSAARIKTDDARQTAYEDVLSLNEVAEQLMDVFCETTKAYVENEASEVEKFRRQAEAIIFSKGCTPDQIKAMVERDEREKSLTLQLTTIYLNCTHFCRLYQQVPIKLQQLMNSTLEKQFDLQKLLAKKTMDDVLTDQRKTEVVYAFVELKDEQEDQTLSATDVVQPVKSSELFSSRQNQSQSSGGLDSSSAENALHNTQHGDYQQERVNTHGNRGNARKPMYDNERPSSSRGSSRNERTNSFRGNRWLPVTDTHVFTPRDRDFIYNNIRHLPSNEFDRKLPRNDNSKNFHEQEKLYFDDRRTPYSTQDDKRFGDVRRHSDSKDSSYDNTWDNRAHRWPSESDYSHDDSENRMAEQTVRSVHSFSNREQQQSFSKSGPSTNPTAKIEEGKQPKKFGEYNKYQGNSRRPADNRKPRYASSNYNEQEEETVSKWRPGQPDREELAKALGYPNITTILPKTRRGAFHNH